MSVKLEKATLGAGCFWCVEAFFQNLNGVYRVDSGYMGGKIDNPTYEDVCSGTSGHAEVVQLEYDPLEISFEDILEVFFQVHDPTTLNKQGADVGSQYRSVIFFHSDEQRVIAEKAKEALDEAGIYASPSVTEISEGSEFYMAEANHQDYFALNPEKGYCSVVIKPKMDAFKIKFKEKLK